MKTEKATPRPWSIETNWHYQTIRGPAGSILASTESADSSRGQANAALIVEAVNNYDRLLAIESAAKLAQEGGAYVVQLCESVSKAGDSPNPFERADWQATVAHCYGAMGFMSVLNKALASTPGQASEQARRKERQESELRQLCADAYSAIIEHHSHTIMHPKLAVCPYCTSKDGDYLLNRLHSVSGKEPK